MNKFKIVEFKSLLFIGALAITGAASAQLELKLDTNTPSVKNSPVPLFGQAEYNLADEVFILKTDMPVLCTHILGYQPVSDLQVKVNDSNLIDLPNALLKNFNLGVVGNVNYNLFERSLNVISENRNKAKCVTYSNDLIIEQGFEEVLNNVDEPVIIYNGFGQALGSLQYEGLVDNASHLLGVNYDVVYTNLSGSTQVMDFVDSWPIQAGDKIGFSWASQQTWFDCNDSDSDVNCGNYDQARIGEITGLTVNPGATLRVSYVKTLIVPFGTPPGDYEVNMMAGIFLKGESSESIGDEIQSAEVTDSSAGQVYTRHVVIEKKIDVIVQ